MPRVTITAQQAPGARGTAGLALTFTAADPANKNQTPLTGSLLLLARNSGATQHAVTITSAPEPDLGRKGDIVAETIAAGATRVYGPFSHHGWAQAADGMLYYEADHAEVLFAPLALP